VIIYSYLAFSLCVALLSTYTTFRRLNLVTSTTDSFIRYSVLMSMGASVYLLLIALQFKLADPGLVAICLSISLWEMADQRRKLFKIH
jgi:hypothetical protein